MRPFLLVSAVAVASGACLGDPAGPGGLRLVPDIVPESVLVGHPGEPLPHLLRVRAISATGEPIGAAKVRWTIVAGGGRIEDGANETDATGYVAGRWVLGQRAVDAQRLAVEVTTGSHQASLTYHATAVPHIIAKLHAEPSSVSLRVGDTLTLGLVAEDPYGNLFFAPDPRWQVLDDSIATLTANTRLVGGPHRGRSALRAVSGDSQVVVQVSVMQYVAEIAVDRDTVRLTSLGQVAPLPIRVLDDRGRRVLDTVVATAVDDPTVVQPIVGPGILSLRNGITRVTVAIGGVRSSLTALVSQVAARLEGVQDSAFFDALGDSLVLKPEAFDALGSPIIPVRPAASGFDTSVVAVSDSLALHPRGEGTSVVRLALDSVVVSTVIVVRQAAVGLSVAGQPAPALTLVRRGDSVATVTAIDRNGFALPASRLIVAISPATVLTRDGRGVLFAQHSGRVEIYTRVDSLVADDSLYVIVAPEVLAAEVPGFAVNAIPDSVWAWAPTAVARSEGGVDLYFATYHLDTLAIDDTVYTEPRANLARAASTDSLGFVFEGVVLPRDSDFYAARGQGIENLVILPRDDGPGYRMLVGAGSFPFGWGIASALSPDGRQWTFEDSGFVVPPRQGNELRPSGEGLVVWQDSVGVWWMISGAHPADNSVPARWSIILYRGTDQRTWVQDRVLLRPGPAGSGRERAVYAPSITEIAPGLWRMYYTGDDLGVYGPGTGQSALWTAVSASRHDWVEEGELLRPPLANESALYPTVVGDLIYYAITDPRARPRLTVARVRH